MHDYKVKVETHTIADCDYQIRSLLDRQQYSDPQGIAERAGVPPAMWPIFGQIWPAGLFLAETMAAFPFQGKRILEVGCGIAVTSLVLHRLGADITSTDLHPLAEEFLDHNLALNDMEPLPFHTGSWAEPMQELGRFDLIIGSDLLYEREHPGLLAAFINRHARAQAEVIIIDPGRGMHGKFNRAMAKLGYRHDTAWSEQQDVRLSLNRGHVLNYHREAA